MNYSKEIDHDLISLTEIEKLLPHRYPFLFVDKILSADNNETVGIKTYDQSFLFYQESPSEGKIVPSLLLVEAIVQCGGAGVTLMGIFQKASWGLASLENVYFWNFVPLNATIKMVVKNLKVSKTVLKQTGTTFYGGQKILEATWLCLRLT